MTKRIVDSEKLPRPFAQYSNAVEAGGFLFVTGHVGLDPRTGRLVKGGIEAQTRATLDTIRTLVEADGLTLDDVVCVNVYMSDYKDFRKMDKVYREYFPKDPPARTCVRASTLKGMLVEINAIAHRSA
jgi:2-iminobutanoate/2-iminopropanoate deaminase